MTAQIIQFKKPLIEAECSFCKKFFHDFKGLKNSKFAICEDCGKACAQRIKESENEEVNSSSTPEYPDY